MSVIPSPKLSSYIWIDAGNQVSSALTEVGLPSFGDIDAIVAIKDSDGYLQDLSWIPNFTIIATLISANTKIGRSIIRRSCSHILAKSVQTLFPNAKLGMGSISSNGFYYDFDIDEPFKPSTLNKLEKIMQDIIKEGQILSKRIYNNINQVYKEFIDEPYKLELIKNCSIKKNVIHMKYENITTYESYNAYNQKLIWKDLCNGPHLPNTRYIQSFKLISSSSSHWLGNQTNTILQRIYGTAWESKEALEYHLTFTKQAYDRDHRKLGIDLDLFSFPDDIGSGLPVFHPKGGVVRKELEDYSRKKHYEAGYEFVNTPHITKECLYITSGHLEWYTNSMYPPMRIDTEYNENSKVHKLGQSYYLKPMNCPMHHLIYKAKSRSYRELPLRFFEFGSVHRYEKSGVVHGLTRVRGMTQDDAHIYTTYRQMFDELSSLLSFVLNLLSDYGLNNYYLELSTKNYNKYVGSEEIWDKSTNILEMVARNSGLDLVSDPGGAAFYGPKISVQVKDALGRNWQMSTIQLDFNMPDRFELEYIDAKGFYKRPILIHRALFGSIERFFGVLTEHYAGAFPAWLAPIQVVCIPVSEAHLNYLYKTASLLKQKGIRVEVDYRSERMAKKIINHTNKKIPFMLIVGDKDLKSDSISFRFGDRTQINSIPRTKVIEVITNWIIKHNNATPTASLIREYL